MRMMSTISQYKNEAQNFVKTLTRETALALAKKRALVDFSKLSREDLNLSKIWSGSSKSLPNLSKFADVNVPSQPFLGQKSMSYPNTFVAKVAKFPISYYKRANWMWKYWMIACVCCLPLFTKFNTEKNSTNSEQTRIDLQSTPTNYAEK